MYPNLGVVDAYATVRRGDRSGPCGSPTPSTDDRLRPARRARTGSRCIEPLQRLRLVCDGDDHGLGFDLTWEGSFPAVQEQPHVMRTGARDRSSTPRRFAQLGLVGGRAARRRRRRSRSIRTTWVGSRDRSWGIRPVGEAEPPGRRADEPLEGFWWLYVPLRFDDFAVIVIVQEEPDGFRTLNDATRVLARRAGRAARLARDRDHATGRARGIPERATLHLHARGGKPLDIEVETLGFVALNVGAGYGGDPDWGHGQWTGRGWVEGAVYDLTDPAVAGRMPVRRDRPRRRGPRATAPRAGACSSTRTFGRHDPSGFADWSSVAP